MSHQCSLLVKKDGFCISSRNKEINMSKNIVFVSHMEKSLIVITTKEQQRMKAVTNPKKDFYTLFHALRKNKC
jgi:hypothetical protein